MRTRQQEYQLLMDLASGFAVAIGTNDDESKQIAAELVYCAAREYVYADPWGIERPEFSVESLWTVEKYREAFAVLSEKISDRNLPTLFRFGFDMMVAGIRIEEALPRLNFELRVVDRTARVSEDQAHRFLEHLMLLSENSLKEVVLT